MASFSYSTTTIVGLSGGRPVLLCAPGGAAGAIGLVFLCHAILDRVRYTDFLVSLLWR